MSALPIFKVRHIFSEKGGKRGTGKAVTSNRAVEQKGKSAADSKNSGIQRKRKVQSSRERDEE